MTEKTFGLSLKIVMSVLLLSGCASSIFPDFADDTQVMIDDGGKVEYRKIDSKAIVVADKENAVYEDEESDSGLFIQNKDVEEEVIPAKTVEVKAEELNSVVAMEEEKPVEEDSVVADNDVLENDVVTAQVENNDIVGQVEEKSSDDVEDNAPSMYYLAETIYFDNGSSVVDYKFYKSLREIAKIAKKNDAMVSVYGYASSRTRNTDPASHKLANFKVSAARAESVSKLLLKYGVKANQIVSQALSDSFPVYQEIMPEGERLNRRVEIYLTY